MPTGRPRFKKEFPLIIADADNNLTTMSRDIFQDLLSEYLELEKKELAIMKEKLR